MADTPPPELRTTPLHALHRALGAKLVPFAGYDMPVQYPQGILAEHLHTRSAAGLFDVSHMGQVRLSGRGVEAALETLVPADIAGLGVGRTRYTQFTNDAGGIRDDLMVTQRGDHLFLVVNAACKAQDLAHLRARLSGIVVEELAGRALLALQGPGAAMVLARLAPSSAAMGFMSFAEARIAGIDVWMTRSGYTGEDGFEISVASGDAEALARRLLAEPEVKPIGLGARDSLRLEAGLCLYGHDIDSTTSPVEADLVWSIQKRRRVEGGFPGAARIQAELASGAPRRSVGILPDGKAPAREGTAIVDTEGRALGVVTSGGFGPSVGGPVAMGYVAARAAMPGAKLQLVVRGTNRPAQVVKMPFAPHRYFRG
jgi:aminomethyltransferase